jgi:hypothetical protein
MYRDPYGYPQGFGYQSAGFSPAAAYAYPPAYANPGMPAQYGGSPYGYNASRSNAREVRLYPHQEDYALQLPINKITADGRKVRCTDAEKLIRFEQALHIEKSMVDKRRAQGINKNFRTY